MGLQLIIRIAQYSHINNASIKIFNLSLNSSYIFEKFVKMSKKIQTHLKLLDVLIYSRENSDFDKH